MPQDQCQKQSQNHVANSLPSHLRPFIAHQNYADYTPRDHAVWRFLLHQLKQNLADSAQPTYLEGLRRTGISLDAIPKIEDINACLNQLGWRAVVVDGFLPPAIFMEFQALKVLVIAVNMRSFEHMLYTPAPDIVHESAGHAPFLIDIDYAEFLQRFGELGMRAIANEADISVYEAIRHLSIIKESTTTSAADITQAEDALAKASAKASAANNMPSEAALLARLHWWTVEYGLVGNLQHYAIFGAGLLSSLGESVSCLDDTAIIKRPLTVNAIHSSYDITAPQPQLFVTESCRHLSQILEEFGRNMACHRGGPDAMSTALDAATVCTVETNSGVQISGKISRVNHDAAGNISYFNTDGPTQLAYADTELAGQGTTHHPHGFGCPIGRLVGFERCLSSYTVDELKRHGIEIGQVVKLTYLSGVVVNGTLSAIVRHDQKNTVLTFRGCTVVDVDGQVLFDPDWGVYDMAVGDSVRSVKGGVADKNTFCLYEPPSSSASGAQAVDQDTLAQFQYYQQIRELRDANAAQADIEQLALDILALAHADWLLVYETRELLEQANCAVELIKSAQDKLREAKRGANEDTCTLIDYALARTHGS